MERKKLLFPFSLIFAGALLGAVFSTVLIYEHNGAKTEIGSSVCDVNASNSCEKARESALGKVFGIPLALIGFLFYGGIIALAAMLALELNDTAIRLLLWGAIAAFTFDVFLLLYSVFVLGGICRLCAITYIGSAAAAAGAYLLSKTGEKMIKPESLSVKAKAVFAVLLVATFAAGIFFNNAAIESQSRNTAAAGLTDQEAKLREQLNNEFYKQWKAGEVMHLDKPASGNKGATKPVLTIVEFADPLCPHCQSMGLVLNEFVKKYADKVKIIFRHYPLDMSCNDAIKNPRLHVGACDLARAIECGEAQGKFWPMHDAVFAQQEAFTRNPVTEKAIESMAQGAGLNAQQMASCFRAQATMAKVKADIAAGNRIKITGTPTTIVNDRKLPGSPLEYVPGILEKILAEESRR